jgi:DNA-binding transcriptional ArsR family regulator
MRFKALAHPLRRDIVERLSEGVATVGEVSRDFGVSKPTISRHLMVARNRRQQLTRINREPIDR